MRVEIPLKAGADAPFSRSMSAISPALLSTQREILVARKQLDAIEQQGRDAVALIDAASAPSAVRPPEPANLAPGVGAQLNVVA